MFKDSFCFFCWLSQNSIVVEILAFADAFCHCISLSGGLTLNFSWFNSCFSSDRLRGRITNLVLLPLQELNNLGKLWHALLVKSKAFMVSLSWINLNKTLCVGSIWSQQICCLKKLVHVLRLSKHGLYAGEFDVRVSISDQFRNSMFGQVPQQDLSKCLYMVL